jgi:peroxiredoxin
VVAGDSAPSFDLPDTNGQRHVLPAEPAPPATVLIQTCNHCPYVIAWNPRLRAVAEDYAPRGVRFLAVNSNDAERYPADSLDHMKRFVAEQSWPIPYLYDESQEVAHALDAVATPHVFVFDSEHRLAYQGAPDSDRADESQGAAWLRGAIDAVLAGTSPDPAETPPRGCSVKWRS